MNRELVLNRIRTLLARFQEEVRIDNATGFFSINVHAENILLKILNIAYDLELHNVNYSMHKNYPAVDLVDETHKVAVQVTSSGTVQKVVNTLNTCVEHGLDKKYKYLYFYFLKGKNNAVRVDNHSISKIIGDFNPECIYLLDHVEFYKHLNELNDLPKLHQIRDLLEEQFADVDIISGGSLPGIIKGLGEFYPLTTDSESVPIFDNNNKMMRASEILRDSALHFIFQYKLSSCIVLQQLIYEFTRSNRQGDNLFEAALIWNKERDQIVYFRSDELKLHLYVYGFNPLYNPNEFLTPIRDCIRGLNNEMGYTADELVALKRGDTYDEYQYQYLIGSLQKGATSIYSDKEEVLIDIKKILCRADDYSFGQENRLFNDLISLLSKLQNNYVNYSATEDQRNDYLRDLLEATGYVCKDQTRGGRSSTGKSAGEIDLLIQKRDGTTIALCEALNLKGFTLTEKRYLNLHLTKLLDNYNPTGIPYLFLISYTDWSKDKFVSNTFDYKKYIDNMDGGLFKIIGCSSIVKNGGFLNCLKADYSCGGLMVTVYHIIIRVAA